MAERITIEQAAAELNAWPELVRYLIDAGELDNPPTATSCRAYLERHHRIEPGTLGHLYGNGAR